MTQQTNAIAPEDVRPGVWLIDPNGNPFEVEFLYKDGDAWCVKSVYDDDTDEQLINCSPIPLSPEVLAVCGWLWNKECKSFECKDIRMNLEYRAMDGSYTMFNYVLKAIITDRIFYLHQLQNLYRSLTGRDLQINAAQLAEAVKGKTT